MKFTAAFVAAFVAMTWSQEAEGFGDKLQVRPTFPNPMRPNRNMFDDDLGGGSFFVEGGVNGGGQNGSPKWDGKIRYERTWDEDDALGYMAPGAGPRRFPKWQVPAKWRLPDKKNPNHYIPYRIPKPITLLNPGRRDVDDDLGGGSFFVEGGVNGGGQNGSPKWDGKIRYERTWDEDDDALGAGQTSHPWLTKLATSSLRSGPDGSCVATTLGNMDRLGIPSFSGGTTADPNNSRGAMVQMVKAGKWTSLNLSGSNLRTIKSAYGTISAYVINADSYERMAKNGQIPSGAIIFQTRHGWSVNSGASGNDMGIVRDRGRYTFNYKLMSPIIYSNAKEVVILVPK